MLLCAEGAGDVLSAMHLAAALIVEAQYRWGRAGFNGGRALRLVADSSGLGTGAAAEACGKHTGIALSGLPTAAGDRGVYLRCEHTALLGIPAV